MANTVVVYDVDEENCWDGATTNLINVRHIVQIVVSQKNLYLLLSSGKGISIDCISPEQALAAAELWATRINKSYS
jgi:hypothetical protein